MKESTHVGKSIKIEWIKVQEEPLKKQACMMMKESLPIISLEIQVLVLLLMIYLREIKESISQIFHFKDKQKLFMMTHITSLILISETQSNMKPLRGLGNINPLQIRLMVFGLQEIKRILTQNSEWLISKEKQFIIHPIQ